MKTDHAATLFTNAQLAFPDFLLEGELLVESGSIAAIAVGEKLSSVPSSARRID